MKLAISFALAALAAAPAAAKDVTTEAADDAMSLPQIIEMFRAAAHHRPDFRSKRDCTPEIGCVTVEWSTREPERDGTVGIEWFIFPDKEPNRPIWCFTTDKHTNQRLCQQAGTQPRIDVTWTEGFFPKAQQFREINTKDPACASFQHSKYEIDNEYVDCAVAMTDAAPPAPTPAPARAPMAAPAAPAPVGTPVTTSTLTSAPVIAPVDPRAPMSSSLNDAIRGMMWAARKRCDVITDHVWVSPTHLSVACDHRTIVAFFYEANGWRFGRPGE